MVIVIETPHSSLPCYSTTFISQLKIHSIWFKFNSARNPWFLFNGSRFRRGALATTRTTTTRSRGCLSDYVTLCLCAAPPLQLESESRPLTDWLTDWRSLMHATVRQTQILTQAELISPGTFNVSVLLIILFVFNALLSRASLSLEFYAGV